MILMMEKAMTFSEELDRIIARQGEITWSAICRAVAEEIRAEIGGHPADDYCWGWDTACSYFAAKFDKLGEGQS